MIVETGQGIPDANSYVTLEEADAYHSLYDNQDWSGDDATLELALMKATRSVDLLYGDKFISYKRNDINDLLFPRYQFYDNNFRLISDTTIPKCLKDAVCTLALKQLLGDDIIPVENNDANIKINRVKVGEIEVENEYLTNKGNSETFVGFNEIDLLLKPVLKTKLRQTIKMVR